MSPIFNVLVPGVDNVANWFMEVPTASGMRAMLTGVGFGLIALAVRSLLGRERAFQ
jgi:hypothetical protein